MLPPKVLREALSNLFAKEGRFQINQMVHHAIHLPSTHSAFCLTHPRSRTMPWRLLTQSSPACTRAWPRNEKMAARTTASRLVLFIRSARSILQHGSPFPLSNALSLLQVFGINVMEQSECSKCGCSSEPVLSQGWIHYGYTNDLMYPFRLLPGFWRVPYAHVRVFRSFAETSTLRTHSLASGSCFISPATRVCARVSMR